VEELSDAVNDDPRSKIWLKCDTCHYTTNYTTFAHRHIKQDICQQCSGPLVDGVCSKCISHSVHSDELEPLPNGENCQIDEIEMLREETSEET